MSTDNSTGMVPAVRDPEKTHRPDLGNLNMPASQDLLETIMNSVLWEHVGASPKSMGEAIFSKWTRSWTWEVSCNNYIDTQMLGCIYIEIHIYSVRLYSEPGSHRDYCRLFKVTISKWKIL